ncbi:MAG: hypothetical protein M3Q63_01665 [bacterium]|nr:hypothetical protein [bacterium]
MDLTKKLFFFLLMPLMVPLALFSNATHELWENLSEEQSGFGKILFFILFPIYVPLALFLNWSFELWVGLAS